MGLTYFMGGTNLAGSPNLVFILLSHQKKNSDGPEKFRKLHVIIYKRGMAIGSFRGPH